MLVGGTVGCRQKGGTGSVLLASRRRQRQLTVVGSPSCLFRLSLYPGPCLPTGAWDLVDDLRT